MQQQKEADMNGFAAVIIATGVIALATIAAIAVNMGPSETIVAGPGTRYEASAADVKVNAPFARVEETDGKTRVKAPFVDITVPEDGNEG
jgi:hypothetical protein